MASGPVAVIGGGTMGAGIAHAFLVAGAEVVLVEAGADLAEAASGRVAASLRKAAERGKLPDGSGGPPARGAQLAPLLARLRVAAGVSAVPPEAELVIEAVPEDAELKRRVLAAAEAAAPDAVIATNTSSLSIGALAVALRRPGRMCGMHFFNPVPASALVELVRHPGTAEDTLRRARDWVTALGLESIVVDDVPGFATSRLGVAVGLEAIRMLEEGVASAEDIDTAMRLGYRWPVGPLRLTDLVGLDVRLAIADYLTGTLGPRFTPPTLLREKVAAGELGKKTGRGFYSW
jgi:3-hydroxybutyryl-CoA dehydrogenase